MGVALGGVIEERYINEYFFEDVSHRIWRKYIKLLQLTAEGAHSIGELVINPLTPNDPYRGRTATLTTKVAFYIFIQQI